jgi:hypothetical protein
LKTWFIRIGKEKMALLEGQKKRKIKQKEIFGTFYGNERHVLN